jgi:hypothetical protein
MALDGLLAWVQSDQNMNGHRLLRKPPRLPTHLTEVGCSAAETVCTAREKSSANGTQERNQRPRPFRSLAGWRSLLRPKHCVATGDAAPVTSTRERLTLPSTYAQPGTPTPTHPRTPPVRQARGRTLLHLAAARAATPSGSRAVAVLLEAGSAVDAADHRGRTPLHEAVQHGGKAAFAAVALLLHAGAKATAAFDQTRTYALWACYGVA